MDLGLTGKAALVTGASRGIGRAIVHALTREGVRIAACARGRETLEDVVSELRAIGANAVAIPDDVSTPDGARRVVAAAIDALSGLDLLVNNVGGSLGSGPFDRATEDKWLEVMNANLMSAVWCSRHAVAWMKDHGGGSIVNVSSICGREYCTSAPYVAAKAGMIGLTKEMAIDLAKYRIRVNSVAPGSIMFPGGSWDRRKKDKPELIEKMLAEHLPFGRFGEPQEVASVVTFLLSPVASWVSGACVPIDGAQGKAF